jgi:hypothetical protein
VAPALVAREQQPAEHAGMESVAELLDRQSRVIARHQAIAAGMSAHGLRRLLRRREWVSVHPGVYVNHTGEPTWLQRAWAAVLAAWPAALCGVSALRATEGPGKRDRDEGLIHVAVDRHRRLEDPEGVRLHRLSRINTRVQWNRSPPRLRYDEAAIDVAIAAADEFAAVAALADAVQSRRTTASRMLDVLAARPRVPRRAWLGAVLADIAEGTCSALEHGYLTGVERPHHLPRADRQPPEHARQGMVYRDVEYDAGLIVELDGRLFHDSARARDADLDRDLDAAVDGRATVRVSWGQVFDRGCLTAGRIGTLLEKRGWTGGASPCGPDCLLEG